MKTLLNALVLSMMFAAPAALAASPGKPAPDFILNDLAGKPVKLSDFRGRYVILEWVNPDCPYVQKHYNSANMQGLQKEYTGQNTAWLTINSTRQDHREYKSPAVMDGW
ncbi:MAG: redoxin domain-containing protein, partial [Burkholderiales bacterium]|nr:redoxin domain-containing protein [Burkholderiales bacterium]